MRAKALLMSALALASGNACAYVIKVPWALPQHEVQLQFSGNAPGGEAWMAGAIHTVKLWQQISGFSWRPVTGNASGCGYGDTISVLRFARSHCSDNFGFFQVSVVQTTTESVNGGPYRLIDADGFLNIGPGADGYFVAQRWPQMSRTVNGGIAGSAPSGGTYAAAFAQAAAAWNTATDFTLTVNGTGSNPCPDNNISAIAFSATVCGEAWGSNVLGVTLSTRSSINGGPMLLVDSDILFNSNYSWDIYDSALNGTTMDFRRVALHELGHLIALGHSTVPEAIMLPSVSNATSLHCDDRRGIAAAYGQNPDSVCAAPVPPAQWHDWQLYPGPLRNGGPEFRRVVGSALGLMMGLGQTTDPATLLYPQISDVEHPTCDDQAGVRAAYGLSGSCANVADVIFRERFQ